ncbi:hypothetical protein SBADM41S_11251 [Streptomyces badius]
MSSAAASDIWSGSSGVAMMKMNSPTLRATTTTSRAQSRGLRVTIASRSIGAQPNRPQLSTVSATRITRTVVSVAGDGRDVVGCCGMGP